MKRKFLTLIGLGLILTMTGCGGNTTETNTAAAEEKNASNSEIYVSFGDSEKFALHLYENETAEALHSFAAMDEWQLPIYHYDDYDNWEVMQYYELPSKYEVPTNPEEVTNEAAGSSLFLRG